MSRKAILQERCAPSDAFDKAASPYRRSRGKSTDADPTYLAD